MRKSFKPVKPVRISEEVAQQLKESILLGHFKTGDRLPTEKELCDEFRVSRTAIREALRFLENAGFVVSRQGPTGGAYVTDLTFGSLVNTFLDLFLAGKISITEMYQMRLIVEPEAARMATLRATPEYITRLKAAMDKTPEFHFILVEMSGNRFLEGFVRSTIDMTGRIVEAVDGEYTHPVWSHGPVVAAIEAGDADAAAQAMRAHLIENGEALMKMEQTYRERKRITSL